MWSTAKAEELGGDLEPPPRREGPQLRRCRTADRNVLSFAASSDWQQFVCEETVPLKAT